MRSSDIGKACGGTYAELLRKLITEELSAAVYTLQYVVPMNTIEITFVSDNFQKITGCDAEIFRNYQRFYEDVVVESNDFFNFLKHSSNNGGLCERKYTIQAKTEGRNILLDCTYSRKISDEIIEFIGVVTNITSAEIYNLAFTISEERLRVALAASGAGFFDWEIGASEIFCDDTAIQLLKLQPGMITLKKCLRAIDRGQIQKCLKVVRSIFSNQCDVFNEDVLISTNSRWLCISGKVIERDPGTHRPRRIAGTVRDVTEMKNILLERERMNTLLEQRVRERTEQLEQELATKIAAEKQLVENLERERELNATKSVFVNMVSHEFRTPLSIIQSSVDLIQRYFDRLSKEDIDSSLLSIQHAVQRMTKTMTDILVLGKVQSSQLKFAPAVTDVVYLCSSIIEGLECSSGPKRIIFEVGQNVPDKLFVDSGLIEHIVSNLLSNALKYSNENVLLNVEYIDGKLLLHVEDHGIGIPKKDAKSVFKLFQRGSNVSNRQGIGVGMFIVKYCVNLHNGDISFRSEEGKGTNFQVVLPASTKAKK
ncbi:MAG: PAS domain-containing sensor histidine kinase [Opitutales bacterium]|nr:PAS domain-containing sensor histidine kinase [Opitutales bacterium]